MHAGGTTGLISFGHSKISHVEKMGYVLNGYWEANYKLLPNPIGCILFYSQLLLYVCIYLLHNPVINRQKEIVKSQVPKFHQNLG